MQDRFFPFHAIGFECNPFRALTPEEWVSVAILSPTVTRIFDAGGHLQLLGSSGSGKTTILRALHARILSTGIPVVYEYLPLSESAFHASTQEVRIYFLDEAQRLAKAQRRRLAEAGRTMRLVLGTHRDFSAVFEQTRQSLSTISLGIPSPEELSEILERRLAFFARQSDRARFSLPAVEFLADRFGSDLRRMEFFLYDYFQEERPQGVVETAPLEEALGRFTPPQVEEEGDSSTWD